MRNPIKAQGKYLIENYSKYVFKKEEVVESNWNPQKEWEPKKGWNLRKRSILVRTIIPTIILFHSNLPIAQASTSINIPILRKAKDLEILPTEIVDVLMEAVVLCSTIGVGLSFICLIIAAICSVLGQKERANSWSVDIIKGLGQIVLAPVIILILLTIASLMFKNIPGLEIFY